MRKAQKWKYSLKYYASHSSCISRVGKLVYRESFWEQARFLSSSIQCVIVPWNGTIKYTSKMFWSIIARFPEEFKKRLNAFAKLLNYWGDSVEWKGENGLTLMETVGASKRGKVGSVEIYGPDTYDFPLFLSHETLYCDTNVFHYFLNNKPTLFRCPKRSFSAQYRHNYGS